MSQIHLYKRGNIWWYHYSLNGKRVQKSTKSTNKRTAQLVISELAIKLDRIAAGLEIYELNELSLKEFYDRIITHIETRKTFETYRTYLLHLNNFYRYLKFTDCENVSNIDVKVIDDFITWRLQNETSANTINHEIDSMRTLFNIAIRLDWIKVNPFVGVERPTIIEHPPHYFSKQEIELIFKNLTPRFRNIFIVLLYTGMRKGELELLTWDDIDFERRMIYIRTKEKRTKNKMRPRAMRMHPDVYKVIKQRQKLNESDMYVFTTLDGNKYGRSVWRNMLKRAMEKARVNSGGIHTFRHSFASHCVQNGMDLYRLNYLMGHTTLKMTMRYSHLAPDKFDNIENYLDFDI